MRSGSALFAASAFTTNGIAVANLRVAVTQRIQQDGQWRDGDTSFMGSMSGVASLKWATAKVERTSQRGHGDRTQGSGRPSAAAGTSTMRRHSE